jgi:hypothetical protein
MLRCHPIEFLGEIEPHKRGSWLKACPLADDNWSVRTVDFDWLYAGPNAIRLALKSVQKFHFSHNGSHPEEPTARMNGRGGC